MKKIIIVLCVMLSVTAQGQDSPRITHRALKADSVYICQSKSAYAYHAYHAGA